MRVLVLALVLALCGTVGCTKEPDKPKPIDQPQVEKTTPPATLEPAAEPTPTDAGGE